MAIKHFGGVTHWGVWTPQTGTEGWSQPGWALPSDPTRYISKHDPYWVRVLDQARQAYGDPNMHYSTDNVADGRRLVFGDGTSAPPDGTIVYHDAATKQSWAQNDDGTVSLVGSDGYPGVPVVPAGYRKIGDRYAPVNDRGVQVGPQLGGVPSNDNGFYADPTTGMLTPKNTNGDYYTVGSDGKKSFFDKSGAPITEDQFHNAAKPRDPAGPPPPGGGLPTDEQQSGKAAEAVNKLQQELKDHYSKISDAEEKLSEVLLNAHATTVAGQQKLNAIQSRIVAAVDNPAMAMDTPAGERAFLTFLRNQVGEINDLVASGALSAEDQSKAARALSALYAADTAAGPAADPPAPSPSGLQPAAVTPAPDPQPSPDPAAVDPGLGPPPRAPDPGLSNLPGGAPSGMPMGADPLSSLASMLPAAAGSFPPAGQGGSPWDALGLAGPLAGLASQLADQPPRDEPAKHDDTDTKDGEQRPERPADQPKPQAPQPPPPDTNGTPGSATPPAPSTAVHLPDGSTVNARTAAIAAAVRACLAGAPLDAAYRQAGIELPPPGTPVTNPVDPAALTTGSVGMFKDHYVVALSSAKALQDGQVVSLSSAAAGPDFLGWIDPLAQGAPAAKPPVARPLMR